MDEVAKAAQEIAKTTGKVIDTASSAGGFLAEFVREPLRERFGIITDTIKYRRWENLLDLQERAKRKLEALGLESQARQIWQIPLNVGVPLLEAASLVEDDYLREHWANLLVNFANPNSGVVAQKALVSVLEEITPLEAVILEKIYALPDEEALGVVTEHLPAYAEYEPPVGGVSNPVVPHEPPEPSEDVALALSNLFRLGCLVSATVWDGGQLTGLVYKTRFGRVLVRACADPATTC